MNSELPPGYRRLPVCGRGEPARITFDGMELIAYEGETLAAALLAAGVAKFGLTSRGWRAPFCGIGICHDCLVTVDGQSGMRSCMVYVRHGMHVSSEDRRYGVGSP